MTAEREAVGPERAAAVPGPATGGSDTSGGKPDPSGRPSGLRNPVRAVRSLGAGTLVIEMLVLLLAIQPIRMVGGDLSGTAVGAIVALAVLAVVLSGLLSRSWAWHAATALQGLLLLASFLHWSLGVLGVIFALVWGYVLHVRRAILG